MQDTEEKTHNRDDIRTTLVVLSGKGGVGKSTIAANIAVLLAVRGFRVGLMDADLHGPSLPKLLGLGGRRLETREEKVIPLRIGDNLKVVSIGFLLESDDDPVIWRGPMKMGAIKQFIEDVDWGPLDCLVVDCPPGTGDEPLSVVQLMSSRSQAIIVSTPQDVALADVRKSVSFCRRLNLPILGVIENMSGFVCPHCGNTVDVFGSGGAERMAAEMGVPFLGRLPLDPAVAESGDSGHPYIYHYSKTTTARLLEETVQPVVDLVEANKRLDDRETRPNPDSKTEPDLTGETATSQLKVDKRPAKGCERSESMDKRRIRKIAVPTEKGQLCMHFGHCRLFTILDIDTETSEVISSRTATPPEHEPGVLPRWVKEQGVDTVIAGGMGSRAKSLFTQQGIEVVVGAHAGDPSRIALDYVNGKLVPGENVCDH